MFPLISDSMTFSHVDPRGRLGLARRWAYLASSARNRKWLYKKPSNCRKTKKMLVGHLALHSSSKLIPVPRFRPVSRGLISFKCYASTMATDTVKIAAAQMTSVNDLSANFNTCSRLVKASKTPLSPFSLLTYLKISPFYLFIYFWDTKFWFY